MGGAPSCFVRVRTNILRQDTSFYIDHFLPFLQRISQIAPVDDRRLAEDDWNASFMQTNYEGAIVSW
jgi:hypothetical protein